MQGHTCFIIAHRLSTIENCDMVLVLEQGRLLRIDVPSKARSELTRSCRIRRYRPFQLAGQRRRKTQIPNQPSQAL